MEPLYKLPTGEWIDLLTITSIKAAEKIDDQHSKHPPRVIIWTGEKHFETAISYPSYSSAQVYVVNFSGLTEAQSYADELARTVNIARGKKYACT